MNTPHEPTHHSDHEADRTLGTGAGHHRPQRAAFWLRAIEARKAKLTREYRKSLRDTARDGISDEEYAAMLGTLEKMARNLGWDESQSDERPYGRGFGRGMGRGHRHPAMLRGHGHLHRRHERNEDVTAHGPQA